MSNSASGRDLDLQLLEDDGRKPLLVLPAHGNELVAKRGVTRERLKPAEHGRVVQHRDSGGFGDEPRQARDWPDAASGGK